MATYPSGAQQEITFGRQRATVVEVGGALRTYTDGESDVIEPFSADQMCDGAHGCPLMPWPNRIAGGRYRFEGVDFQLPLTEPERQNAIHGLLRWRNWHVLEKGASKVVMGVRLHPQPGYPFCLDAQVSYELTGDGLVVSLCATNVGEGPLPYAAGHHPYLSPGTSPVDACSLQLEADTQLVTDADRQVPIGREPVQGTRLDFGRPRLIGPVALDCGFTGLSRDKGGLSWARLSRPDGRMVELWVDGHFTHLQVFTGDTLQAHRRRRGLAVEPMTAPANAFQTGEGLVSLAPGDTHRSRWGLSLR